MEPKTEPEPKYFSFSKRSRNREINDNGTGTAGTENFFNCNCYPFEKKEGQVFFE